MSFYYVGNRCFAERETCLGEEIKTKKKIAKKSKKAELEGIFIALRNFSILIYDNHFYCNFFCKHMSNITN